MANAPLRILLIGPWSASVGGTVVLFRRLVEDLRSTGGVAVDLVDTGRPAPGLVANAGTGLRTLSRLMVHARDVDVITFHASVRAATWFSPFLALLARLHRKPWMLRVFGGNLDNYYERRPVLMRQLMKRTAFSADLCAFETRSLVTKFEPMCRNRVEWLPNARPLDSRGRPSEPPSGARRFLYLGIVKPSKGVYQLVEAGKRLHAATNGVTQIDIYGPVADGVAPGDFDGAEGVRYYGEVPSDSVVEVLSKYDALVLPTTYEGEGYPGVILEAFGVGLPVVATRWRSIPEIVDETCGVLVEPHDVEDLVRGMQVLMEPQEHRTRAAGAWARRERFSTERWTSAFVDWCRDMAARRT